MITLEALKKYIAANIIKEYDVSPLTREQHDKQIEEWRNNRR